MQELIPTKEGKCWELIYRYFSIQDHGIEFLHWFVRLNSNFKFQHVCIYFLNSNSKNEKYMCFDWFLVSGYKLFEFALEMPNSAAICGKLESKFLSTLCDSDRKNSRRSLEQKKMAVCAL